MNVTLSRLIRLSTLAVISCLLTGCGETERLKTDLKNVRAEKAELEAEQLKLSNAAKEAGRTLDATKSSLIAIKAENQQYTAKKAKLVSRHSYLQMLVKDLERQVKELETESSNYRAKHL
jgi:chromosome segregation ATPase